jgi:sulfonate transport system substrate-binding protein
MMFGKRHPRSRAARAVAAGSLLVTLLAGCGSAGAPSKPAPAPAQGKPAATAGAEVSFPGGKVKPLSPPVTVRVADDKDPAGSGGYFASALGYFKRLGINIQLKTFSSGADEFTSLSNGQIDVARGLISAALFNANAQGLNVRVVADGGHNGRNPYFALMLADRYRGKVTTYAQLKGLHFGLVSFGNVNQLFLDRALAKGGLTDKDVKITTVDSFSDLVTAMGNGAIDGAMEVQPDIWQAQQRKIAFVFKNPRDYAPNEEASVIMFSPKFARETAVAERYMLAYLEGVRYYDTHVLYAKSPSIKALGIIAKAAGWKTSVLKPVADQYGLAALRPTGGFSVRQLEADQQWYHRYGSVKKTVPIDTVADRSFIGWANKLLGPYHRP